MSGYRLLLLSANKCHKGMAGCVIKKIKRQSFSLAQLTEFDDDWTKFFVGTMVISTATLQSNSVSWLSSPKTSPVFFVVYFNCNQLIATDLTFSVFKTLIMASPCRCGNYFCQLW